MQTLKEPACHVQFWSSVEYGAFMRGLVNELRDAGWDASHCFHISDRAYRGSRSKSARLWLRIRMYLCYPFSLAWRIFFSPKPLIAVVNTNTFYAPLLATFVPGFGKVKVVHLVYDLFPDALFTSGHVREDSIAEKILASVTDATMKRCDRNVFLGRHLIRFAGERHRDIPRATVIPVGASGKDFAEISPEEDHGAGPMTVLYCGNLGYMHDIATFTGALTEDMAEIDKTFRFLFHAGGPCLNALVAQVAALPADARAAVRIEKNLAHADWVKTMSAAHIALVTMVPGAEKVVMPSKSYSALMAGQAILAICPPESDLGDTVREHDCGWVIEPGDAIGLRRLLKDLASNRNQIFEKRIRALRAGRECFDTRIVAAQWASLFEGLRAGRNS